MTEKDLASMNLKELMQQAGIKQKYIAKKAKVSPAAVSLVTNGKSKSQRIEDLIREEAEKAMAEAGRAPTKGCQGSISLNS